MNIGFGDIIPSTDYEKVFGIFFMIFSTAVFG